MKIRDLFHWGPKETKEACEEHWLLQAVNMVHGFTASILDDSGAKEMSWEYDKYEVIVRRKRDRKKITRSCGRIDNSVMSGDNEGSATLQPPEGP